MNRKMALLAASGLDETTLAAFVSFGNDDLTTLLEKMGGRPSSRRRCFVGETAWRKKHRRRS
jgi:hypothetical protein